MPPEETGLSVRYSRAIDWSGGLEKPVPGIALRDAPLHERQGLLSIQACVQKAAAHHNNILTVILQSLAKGLEVIQGIGLYTGGRNRMPVDAVGKSGNYLAMFGPPLDIAIDGTRKRRNESHSQYNRSRVTHSDGTELSAFEKQQFYTFFILEDFAKCIDGYNVRVGDTGALRVPAGPYSSPLQVLGASMARLLLCITKLSDLLLD
ncbi:hypothetical protein T492DRAFT_836853 [Pavlovales sp. CCMP2436]|nr:hypothetical protein T492DRAFT_836853 [Pavlovales sp. CCMP2436]